MGEQKKFVPPARRPDMSKAHQQAVAKGATISVHQTFSPPDPDRIAKAVAAKLAEAPIFGAMAHAAVEQLSQAAGSAVRSMEDLGKQLAKLMRPNEVSAFGIELESRRLVLPLPDELCPHCSVDGRKIVRRLPGEVRVHLWLCGCAVRPETLGSSNTNSRGHAEFLKRASGHGAIGEHPTEEGAIAAWRENLARLQGQG